MENKRSTNVHRDKITSLGSPHTQSSILVHEPIPPRDVKYIPEAQAALQKEWDKLRDQGAWDLGSVREMSELKSEYKRRNKTAHFGIVFSICHKKHAEKAPSAVGAHNLGRVARGVEQRRTSWFF